MKQRPSLDEIFMGAPQAAARPSLDEIFMPTQGQAPVEQPIASAETGFTADMRKRGADLANIVAATGGQDVVGAMGTGKQSLGEGVLQAAGTEAGALWDIANRGVGLAAKTGFEALPENIQSGLKQSAQTFGEGVRQTKLGKTELAGLQAAGQGYGQFQEQYPRAARNVEAVANLAPFVSPVVRGVAGKGLEAVAAPVKSVLTKEVPPLTSSQRKIYSSALYDQAEAVGGVLKPEARQQFINEIAKHADIGGERLVSGKNVFEDMLETTSKNADKPLTLKGFQTIDSKLTDLIHKERSPMGISDEGRRLVDLQDNLRELVDNPNPEMVVGGREGFNALRQATTEYKLTKQQEELESMISYANKTDNPATSLKAQMRTLSDNPKRLAGYDDAQRKIINQAATSSKFADFLRTTAGSRLIGAAIGAGAAGAATGGIGALAGAVGGAITGAGARGAATALKTREIRQLEKSIAKKSAAEQIPREIYKLPPEKAKTAIRKLRESK